MIHIKDLNQVQYTSFAVLMIIIKYLYLNGMLRNDICVTLVEFLLISVHSPSWYKLLVDERSNGLIGPI